MMKKLLFICILSLFMMTAIYSQPPQAFNYQTVVRDPSGEIITNQDISFRIGIRNNNPNGTILYQEIHTATTNVFGLANLVVGDGSATLGNFTSINWGSGTKYLQVEYDPSGGTSFTNIGTSELQSVPYALFSQQSSNDYWDKSGNNIYYNGGNAGIGTSNPLSMLHVYGGGMFRAGNAGISIGTSPDCGTIGYIDHNTYNANLMLYSGKTILNGSIGIGTTDPANAVVHISGASEFGNIIRFENTGTNGADCFLGATSNAWGNAENSFVIGHGVPGVNNIDFTINSYGWVGIGEDDPAYPLHVKKDAYASWVAGIHNTETNSGSNGLVVRADGGVPLWVQNAGGTVFAINQTGNVGIHTTTPDADLHVDDRIRVGEDPNYSSVYGELYHEGGGNGFKINAHAGGGGWADMHLQTNGNTKMFIESSGKVGIGTTSPYNRLQIAASGSENAFQSYSPNGNAIYGLSATGYGVFGQSTSFWAGYFSGNVHVSGAFSKGAGSFVIDHPLDPENRLLRHNFVESPENLLIYRGKVELDNKGEAIVALPGYFKVLTKEDEATVQLTPIGKPTAQGSIAYSYEWSGSFDQFTIYGEPGRNFSWMVLADRDDPVIRELARPVEEEKGGRKSLCEKGKLLYPKAYGYPEDRGRDYQMMQKAISNANEK